MVLALVPPGSMLRTSAAVPLAVLLLALGASPASVVAFMYRPTTGLVWDPSCLTWKGKTYCYFMYICGTGTPGCTQNATHCESLPDCQASAAWERTLVQSCRQHAIPPASITYAPMCLL
eukprot:SAG31_NODE_4671_length_3046_cov_1.695623_3_plen_119_part_00